MTKRQNQAEGFSPATVSQLKQKRAEDYKKWQVQRPDQDKWVYLRADGSVSRAQAAAQAAPVRNCTKDEGRSLGVALQEEASNHLKRL